MAPGEESALLCGGLQAHPEKFHALEVFLPERIHHPELADGEFWLKPSSLGKVGKGGFLVY